MTKIMEAEVGDSGFSRAVSQAERISMGLDGNGAQGIQESQQLDLRILNAEDLALFQQEG